MKDIVQVPSRPRPILAAALLVAATAAVYFNSLHGAFVWDDIPTIAENPAIEHVASALRRPAAVNTTSGRPLVGLSLVLNHALGGRNPEGYHLFNVLVHMAAALALFGFVRRLALLPRWAGRYESHATGLALAVAAVWALHPLQTQAVTYVIQRAESMMGLCYLLTLYFFLRGAEGSEGPRTMAQGSPMAYDDTGGARSCRALESGRSKPAPLPSPDGSQNTSAGKETTNRGGPVVRSPVVWCGASVVACALGMTAKEVMVSAPVVVLLFDRTFLSGSFRRALASKRLYYSALFGTWLILGWLVFSLGGNRDGSTGGLSPHAAWGAYWLTQFPAIATYLKLAFFPHPLIFQYGQFWLPSAAAALPGALVVVPLVALTGVALVRWPEAGFLGFWFFSVLAVTSLVPGTVDMIVDYRMYLALAPLWILVAAAGHWWRPRIAPLVLGAAALAFGAVTVARNRDYRSLVSLWTDNVTKRPGNALGRYNLAASLMAEAGHTAEAEAQLETAIKLNPDLAMAHYDLAWLLAQQPGGVDRAMAHYEEAIRIAPNFAQAHNNLAVLLHDRRQLPEACRQFQLAVQYDPSNLMAWLNLAQVFDEQDRADDAIGTCANLVRAHPDFALGQAKLGILLATRNRSAEAIPHLAAALRLDPTQDAARFYLGAALVQRAERLPEAAALLEVSARQRPDSAVVRFTLGTAYLAAGDRARDAIEQFSAAVRLDPKFAEAHYDLGLALEAGGGNRAEALAQYRAAAVLRPEAAQIHFRLACLLAGDSSTLPEARAEVAKTLALNPRFPGAQALLEELDAAAK